MARVLLLVADHIAGRVLEQAGHTVSMAASFAQVLEGFSHTGAEVVLTDLHIPNSESLRLIDHLHTEFPLNVHPSPRHTRRR